MRGTKRKKGSEDEAEAPVPSEPSKARKKEVETPMQGQGLKDLRDVCFSLLHDGHGEVKELKHIKVSFRLHLDTRS